jgi:hypothetical protein
MINFPEGMKDLYNDIQNDNEWQMLSDAIWLNKLPNTRGMLHMQIPKNITFRQMKAALQNDTVRPGITQLAN